MNHDAADAGAPNGEDAAAPSESAANDLPPPAAEPSAEKRPRKERSEREGMPRITNPDDLEQVMESPLMRNQPLDIETVPDEDTAAFQKMQTLVENERRAGFSISMCTGSSAGHSRSRRAQRRPRRSHERLEEDGPMAFVEAGASAVIASRVACSSLHDRQQAASALARLIASRHGAR